MCRKGRSAKLLAGVFCNEKMQTGVYYETKCKDKRANLLHRVVYMLAYLRRKHPQVMVVVPCDDSDFPKVIFRYVEDQVAFRTAEALLLPGFQSASIGGTEVEDVVVVQLAHKNARRCLDTAYITGTVGPEFVCRPSEVRRQRRRGNAEEVMQRRQC